MTEPSSSELFPIISDCGCSEGSCSPPESGMDRREFLRLSGLASAAMMFGGSLACGQGSESARPVRFSPHLIPADKNPPLGWLRSLYARGERTGWKGDALATVGMPVNGIGAGQLYVCGDGTLGQWEIFNDHEFLGYGARNYARRTISRPVIHGVALHVEQDGTSRVRMLDETGFENVSFRGEHPIALVRYEDESSPVSATLEAFPPFIPLNAKDSALPATIMLYTLQNRSSAPAAVSLLSWLENPVARKAGEQGWKGRRVMQVQRNGNGARIVHSARSLPPSQADQPERSPILFADFEGSDFGNWSVEGTAFGTGPAGGALPVQTPVENFRGKGFANSYHGRDETVGTLVSPPFTVSRRYINFLLGGGDNGESVGIRLLVDGDVVRQARGDNSERLKQRFWDVSEFEGREARLEIYDKARGPWGHVLVDEIEFADTARGGTEYKALEEWPDYGTLAWSCAAETLEEREAEQMAGGLPQELRRLLAWSDSAEAGLTERRASALVTRPVTLQPGESKTIPFVLTWHFPNTFNPDREAGHEYAARFDNAGAVADYVLAEQQRLIADTRKWRDTWYDSTLPVWLLDRIHLTADCLQTGTTQWWKNGRFWAWEGVVCCPGTCTHVWNYAQSLARLFPELERNVRERQDLGVGLEPTGLVGFRHNGNYAADGQCGTVLKIWREHQMSADDTFLRSNWPATRKVIDFLLEQDENADGLIENRQHNTYDIDFFGANTFVGSLYLAALRAGEEMAREMGDNEYADRLRSIYELGRRLSEEKLWNGEYFIQQVDLKEHPEHQYGPGCLSDQLFGQNWAHQTGLGYIYSPEKVKTALQSVWKYNWAPDTGVYNEKYPPERPFSDDAEAGLFICTWPGSRHLDNGVRYRDEVWTGIEYQVASGMLYEDLVDEGLAVTRAVHDRYDPARRNPYNEVECSDFYARAMASWGVLLALSGYRYHGPKGTLAFAPRITPKAFRCAFTTAEGWGTFDQKAGEDGTIWTVDLKHGRLHLNQLELQSPDPVGKNPAVAIGSRTVQAEVTTSGNSVLLKFPSGIDLKAGESLTVRS